MNKFAFAAAPLLFAVAACDSPAEEAQDVQEEMVEAQGEAVSYTHLTLPTICSV